jgi:CRP-like cAMP-binding protein
MLTNFIIEHYKHFEYAFVAKKVKRNQVIYLMGDQADELFYVKDGKIKTSLISVDGKERILEIYEKGSFFGEICLCSNGKRSEQAIAYEDAIISSLKTRDFVSLVNKQANMMNYFLNFFSKKLSEYAIKLEKTASEFASLKIAKVLLKAAKNKTSIQQNNSNDNKILLSLTAEQLKQKLSFEPKLVNEVLNKFLKEELIEYRKQKIIAHVDKLIEFILK